MDIILSVLVIIKQNCFMMASVFNFFVESVRTWKLVELVIYRIDIM